MAAELAGTAAIRLVPSLTGFRQRAQTELQRQKGLSVDVDIRPKVDTSVAKRQLERFRAKEEADAINLKAKIDEADFKRQFQRVEHVFERSAFAKAFRLQIKVIGADALYSLIGVAGSAAAALDTVVKSAAVLPGALAAAGLAAGVFALALGDVKKAITALQTEQDQTADKARAFASAQRDSADAADDVAHAQQDVAKAVKSTIRTYEDLAHAVRGTSLDEADALLNVQESYDKLATGGQKSLLELRRDQLAYARDLHNLDGVRIQNKRTLEDYNDAQRVGVQGSSEVVHALEAVADAQNRVAAAASQMADATSKKTDTGAFARLSPSAKEFATAVTDAHGAWVAFTNRLQEGVFKGQATNMVDTLNTSLLNMGPNLDRVAGQIGGVFTDLGAIIRRTDVQGFLSGIAGNTANTLGTLRKGLDPLITGFLRMADVGSRHLPQLADLFNRLFDRFNAWTVKISGDGSLDKWITDGIAGLQSLINITQNIILIVGDVASAWRKAGGEQSGMIGDAEHLTEVIHQWTSGEGMATMVQQFKNVRDWTGRMVEAIKNIWPTIVQIAQTVREWSVTFFTILGYMFRMTAWVQEHTGMVKFLVAAYLSIRTVKPIWDILTNAAKAYTNVMMRASTLGGPAGAFAQNSVQGLATVQTAMGKTGTAAQTMAGTFTTSQDKTQAALSKTSTLAATTSQGPLARLSQAFTNMITPVNSTAGQINKLNGFLPDTSTKVTNLGTAAGQATSKVGGGAAGKVGLFGAVSGLAGFIGPGLAFAAAVTAAVWVIDKMGEAHRKAAAEAQNQKNQLDALKSTLDSFTGAFTPQTAIDTAKQAQGFDIPGLGKRNIQQDLASTGLPFTQQQLVSATNPVNTQLRDQMLAALEAQTRGRVEASKTWDQHGYWLRDNGFDINMLVRAMSGDPAMIAKFNAIPQEPDGQGGYLPKTTLTDFATGAGTPGSLTTSIFLRDTSSGYGATGTASQQASAAAFGTGTLKPGVQGYGPNPQVTMISPDTAKITTSGPITDEYIKNFPSDVGTVEKLPDGRGAITLTREGTLRDIEHHREGGMIRGVGSGMSDSNLIMASRGEYIIRKAAVDAMGVQNLDRMNSMRFRGFNVGGLPFPIAPPPPSPVITPPPPITPVVTPEPYQPTIDAAAPAPAPATPEPPVLPPTPMPTVPMTTTMPYSPYAGNGQPSYSMTQLPPGMGPGPLGPVQADMSQPNHIIVSYLANLARQNGLRVGAGPSDPDLAALLGTGVHPADGKLHTVNEALDIGNGPDDVALAQWWIQDPARVASTKELILNVPGWDTTKNIKNGKFVGNEVYDQGTLNDHTDHMHLALSNVPNSQGGIMINGQPVSYDAYQPTIGPGGYPGMPGSTGGGADSNLPLGDRIAKMYENAFKPENLNKFIFGQIENVGQSLMGIGLSFIKGFTGIDFSQLTGIGQQVMQHFTGSGSGGGGSDSTLQAGSPMDNAVSGNISSFFDPMGGVQLPGMPHQGGGGAGPGPVNKAEVAKYIYGEGIKAGLTPGEAVALVAYAIGESGLDPGSSGGVQSVAGSPGGDADTVLGLFQEKPAFAQAGGVDPSQRGTVQGNVQAYIANLMKHRGEGDILDQLLATSQGGPMHTGGRGAMEGLIGQAKSILGFSGGGFVPARVSRGEYRMSPNAVAHYGLGMMNAVNAGHYAFGGLPGFILPQGNVSPHGPLPMPPPPPLPRPPDAIQMQPPRPAQPAPPAVRPAQPPGGQVQQQAPAPAPVAPSAGPPTGSQGAPSPGEVPNFTPFIPGIPTGQTPVPAGMAAVDARSQYQGPAPASNQHNIGWLDKAIKEGAAHAGQLGAMAASMGSMGMGGGMGGLIQGAAQIGGQAIAGIMNVISSAGVGTIMGIGTKATPSGAPLLPQNPIVGFGGLPGQDQMNKAMQPKGQQPGGGGPLIMNVYNGGIHTQNMDEWQRRQQLLERQQEQPLTNSFVH